MSRPIYIQALNGIPQDDWAFTAYLGFAQRGSPIIFFEDGEIEAIPTSKAPIVVAGIDNTLKYFSGLNIAHPSPLNIPPELIQYTHRKVSVMSLKSFKETSDVPVFVKPLHKSTLFPAGVITKRSSFQDLFYGIPDDTQVMTSEYLDIVSEYRGFVIDGVLKALHWYAGNFVSFPDVGKISQAIFEYKNAPAGYTIDFGVTADDKTVLIECNDGWSIGSYGCDPQIYSRLLARRWMEITKF